MLVSSAAVAVPNTWGCHADSSVTPVATCACTVAQHIVFAGAQSSNQLASDYTLFSVYKEYAQKSSAYKIVPVI